MDLSRGILSAQNGYNKKLHFIAVLSTKFEFNSFQ